MDSTFFAQGSKYSAQGGTFSTIDSTFQIDIFYGEYYNIEIKTTLYRE